MREVTVSPMSKLIASIEGMPSSRLHVETDASGYLRIVELERIQPPPEVAAELEAMGGHLAAASAAPIDVDALIERCVAALDEMFDRYGHNQRQLAQIEPVIKGVAGPLYAALAERVDQLSRENQSLRNGAAAALRGLVEELTR